MAFPTTSVLDSGVRADEGPPPSASWSALGINSASNLLRVVSNKIVTTAGNQNGVWGTEYGPDSEIFMTVTTLPVNGGALQMGIRLVQYGGGTVDGYRMTFTRADTNPGFDFSLFRLDNSAATQLGATVNEAGGAIAAGIQFGVDIIGSTITGYANRSGTWSSVGSASDGTYTASGGIGLRFVLVAGINDFGGGTVAAGASTGLAWITA